METPASNPPGAAPRDQSAPISPTEATLLLQRVQQGDESAAEHLLPLVYEQLRATAGSFFRAQRADHTLQPTALVHEAYVKLVQSSDAQWEGRAHFCAVAAKAMRQILHDHARRKKAAKRSADGHRELLTHIETPSSGSAIGLIELDEALSDLAAIDERSAHIVELRFFGGLTNEQIARVIDTSLPTVERSWRRSRAWLKTRLGDAAAEPADSDA